MCCVCRKPKLEDGNFPLADIKAAHYESVCSGQKTYNGIAILSRILPTECAMGIVGYDDPQKRIIAATIGDVRVICVYVPNGESVESDKYRCKLDWFARLNVWLKQELTKYPRLALLGDYNIGPEDRDVHDPKAWEGKVLFSEPEKAAFRDLIALGLRDSFRLFDQPEKSYSWWDYRMNGFKRDFGLRIDHILLSADLAKLCKKLRNRPSAPRARPAFRSCSGHSRNRAVAACPIRWITKSGLNLSSSSSRRMNDDHNGVDYRVRISDVIRVAMRLSSGNSTCRHAAARDL